jgi:signal transduction histidine kinase
VVVLDVVDDGRGFEPGGEPSADGTGYGLTAMRSRLRHVGGTLTIESEPGDGTAISAAVPLACLATLVPSAPSVLPSPAHLPGVIPVAR